jgi:hypothetical protein
MPINRAPNSSPDLDPLDRWKLELRQAVREHRTKPLFWFRTVRLLRLRGLTMFSSAKENGVRILAS